MKEEDVPNKAKIVLGDDGILLMRMLPKASILEQDAIEICKVAAEISGDLIHCNLVDISDMTFMDKKARAVFASQKKTTVPAVAILNKSKIQRSLVNLYFGFSKPIIPTKAFTDEAEARAWLRTKL
jgi:hypothetical protein